MSLRATFLLLLLANLAFLGWAALIDVPSEPPQNDSISNLPQLKLLGEERGKASSSPGPAVPAGSNDPAPRAPAAVGRDAPGASTPNGSAPAAAPAGPPTAGAPLAGIASGGAAPIGANSGAVPAIASAAAPGRDAAGAVKRCITIGPFTDPENAREAAEVLRGRGFTSHGRTAASRSPQGYWVFVGGLKTPADETSVLYRLERNGISDAKVMPTSDAGRRVSVGLFNSLDGAQRRAQAVRHLGIDAQVEPRSTAEAHWVDVDLDSSGQSLPAEDLLSLEEAGSRLEIKECPASESGTGTLTAAGRAGPG